MKYRYSRFVPGLLDDLDFESLLSKLSDLLLASGFDNPWDPQSEDDRTLQALHDAILDALLNGGVLSDEMLDQLLDGTESEGRRALEALVQQIIERLTDQGFVSTAGPPSGQQPGTGDKTLPIWASHCLQRQCPRRIMCPMSLSVTWSMCQDRFHKMQMGLSSANWATH